MKLVRTPEYIRQLHRIQDYIGFDKPSAAIGFRKTLDAKLELLRRNPYTYRKSYYYDDASYRDLVFKGYTVIYQIEPDEIRILEIFKWVDR